MPYIDHEEFSKLYQENPEEFRKKTRQIVNDFITGTPTEHQKKLRELQIIIDAEVIMSRDPLDALRKISKMMLEMYSKKGGLKDRYLQAEFLRSGLLAASADLKINLNLPNKEDRIQPN